MPDPWLADRRQPRDSLATKIIFFVFLSTFLTAVVVSWVAVHSSYSFLRSHLEHELPAALQAAGEALGHEQAELAHELARLAEAPAVRAAAGGDAGARAGAESLLRGHRGRSKLAGLALRDTAGVLCAGTPSPPPREPGLPADALLRPAGDRFVMGVPVLDDRGQAIGRLDASLEPSEALRGAGGSAPAAWLHLVDPRGRILARGGATGEPTFASFPAALLAGPAGPGLREFRAAGERRAIAVVQPLASGGASLVVAQLLETAYAPLFTVVTRIFVIDLAVVLLFSFLAYEITSAIVRPLEQLSEAARRISQGELEVEIAEQPRRDEIGLLTRTFNDMARRLRRNRAEIEQHHRQLREQNEQLQQANEVLEQLSITDGLTKLHNHRYFQETLTREIKRVSRTGETLALLLIDIDDFKALNDRLGHAAGDAVLVRIARILNESVRESDVLARYGGEEFVVLAPGTDLEGVAYLAEKVRTAVAEALFGLDPAGEPMRVTVSIGVAEYAGDRRAFFDVADRALYRAKAAGKNCVAGLEELGRS
ncbi:MAG: diguanylate cyclase [Deltaproteobacteria bacterium]|nr:diguanylate cyclase [Deltaproteobacteria bacterium]